MIAGIAQIDENLARFISDNDMYVLRDVRTGQALNASFSIEGLYWSTDHSNRLLCFRNARLQPIYKNEIKTNLRIVGDTRLSEKVYVEKFVPRNQTTLRGQLAEYTWMRKAYALLRSSS